MIKIALIGLAALIVYDVVRGIIKKRGRYHLKKNINDLRFITTLLVVMFFLMGVVTLVTPIAEWTKQTAAPYAQSSDTYFILSLAPYVWICVGLWVSTWLFSNAFKPFWKYSEQEEVWRKEEKDKGMRWWRKILPFIKWKEEKDE